jgi:hypothetical protein
MGNANALRFQQYLEYSIRIISGILTFKICKLGILWRALIRRRIGSR